MEQNKRINFKIRGSKLIYEEGILKRAIRDMLTEDVEKY